MFSLICIWINGWVNNREAGHLRRYLAHYYVIVMPKQVLNSPLRIAMKFGNTVDENPVKFHGSMPHMVYAELMYILIQIISLEIQHDSQPVLKHNCIRLLMKYLSIMNKLPSTITIYGTRIALTFTDPCFCSLIRSWYCCKCHYHWFR